jgi:hypothetical protein
MASLMDVKSTSVASRLCANTMVGILSRRNRWASFEASPRYGARIPSSGLTTGGL